jgi:hypothetical protein
MNDSLTIKERENISFPTCSRECSSVELLGVGECENVCPHKFYKDGTPKTLPNPFKE